MTGRTMCVSLAVDPTRPVRAWSRDGPLSAFSPAPEFAGCAAGAEGPSSAPASAPVAPAVQQQPTAGSAELGEQFSPQKVRDMALRRLQLAVRDFASVCEAQGLPESSVSGDLAIARRAEQAVFPSARTRPLQATDDLGFVTPVKRPRLSFPKLTKSSVAGRPSGLTKPALPEHTSRAGPSVAAGGLFKPPRLPASFPTSVVKPSRRSFSTRRVSPDLPYSLVVADSAGFQQGVYVSSDQAVADLQHYYSFVSDQEFRILAPSSTHWLACQAS